MPSAGSNVGPLELSGTITGNCELEQLFLRNNLALLSQNSMCTTSHLQLYFGYISQSLFSPKGHVKDIAVLFVWQTPVFITESRQKFVKAQHRVQCTVKSNNLDVIIKIKI